MHRLERVEALTAVATVFIVTVISHDSSRQINGS